MNKKIISLALVLGLVTLLGACDTGGGGVGDSTSPSPVETTPLGSPSP